MREINIINHPEAIAVIGLSGRFPGSNNISEYWNNLRDGVEGVTFFSKDELVDSGIDPALLDDPNYVRAKGVIDDVDLFDAAFFGINPREAEVIDPQHRLFLECAWEALENAGYDPETYEEAIGVYAGASMNSYIYSNLMQNPVLAETVGGYQIMLGNDKDFLTTRVSYKLNLTGPSVNVQTACSTSLVAVQFACQALLDDQCDMALAGGVSAEFPQKAGYLYQEGMILSPDGRCRAFDEQGKGIVGGEGVGIVVLKRLADAIEDRDHIFAVIRGSAINNDGSLKVGYTAPSVSGQAEAIAMAQAIAEVDPESITYIEAHGTGTILGDPIEIAALTEVFRENTDRKGYCAIGSVKTNIGHLDVAAGVAGLIKTVLALQHKQIPPSLHFTKPNPKIDLANSPFYVNTELLDWQTNGVPRRAGVSSFGIGGTNAHVILEEAPAVEPSVSSRKWHLLPLSARSSAALDVSTQNLINHFKEDPDLNLAHAAYTLQIGRRTFNHRRFAVCQDIEGAIKVLETAAPETISPDVEAKSVVFMFTGQGAQYVNMGRDLYQQEPLFREHVDKCAELLQPQLGLDLREVVYPTDSEAEEATEQLKQTAITQPALFVIEYALAKLLMAWGISPQAMIGHSIGEYVAACLAGVISLEDAITLVATRGRLMQDLPAGSMLAIYLPENEIRPLLSGNLSLATINAPSLCVVSGPTTEIQRLAAQLEEQGINSRRLRTSHAFHSQMMDPILEPFTEQVSRLELNAPAIPFISNVTGTWITAEEATSPKYWARHIRQAVRFSQGVQTLFEKGTNIFLEVGPGSTLTTLVKQQPELKAEQLVQSTLRHPVDKTPDLPYLLKAIGQLWTMGVEIDWAGYHADEKLYRLPLPSYPFERQRYWVEPQEMVKPARSNQAILDKRKNPSSWFYLPSWKRYTPPEFLRQPDLTNQKTWLVFLDNVGLGSGIVARLEQAGHKTIRVEVGKQFSQVNELTYTVNPASSEDYVDLINALRSSNSIPGIIIHLWSLTTEATSFLGLERLDETENLGFYSLLNLAQAIGAQPETYPIKIEVISNNLFEVTGSEMLLAEKSTILGPCRVIPHEYPQIDCRVVDLSEQQFDEVLIGQLISEVAMNVPDPVVAYRGNHRWVQDFESFPIEEVPEGSLPLRKNGVYLITGGFGGIGLVLAEFLARTVQAKLVLTGRSEIPEREQWDTWSDEHDSQDSISEKIRSIRVLEELGAEVLAKKANVADLSQMKQVLAETHERFGVIDGVIHAAGLPGGGLIQLKTREMVSEVFEPKVKGTLVLESVLKNEPLDFYILCSSINSVLTSFGQVDYCAANNFQDAFAHARNSRNGTSFISINWDTWQEVGMAVNLEVPVQMIQQKEEDLKHGFSNSEGADVFSRILANRIPQILVSTQDFESLFEQNNHVLAANPSESLELETAHITKDDRTDGQVKEKVSESKYHPRPALTTDYVAPRNEIEEMVARIWQDLMGIEPLGVHDNFFELGGHSLLATQLVSRLQKNLCAGITLQNIFESSTIGEQSELIQTMNQVEESEDKVALIADDREEFEI